jgi:Zn-dependent protease
MLDFSLSEILILIPTILIALTVHELSHAVVALWRGDDTAKTAGRITLNPLKHVDPMGFAMLILVGFGWAKPVFITREKLKNPNADEILIAFAGPVSNLLLALIFVLILKIGVSVITAQSVYNTFLDLITPSIAINIALAIFNSLPIPPLDGSHIFAKFLSQRRSRGATLFRKYGFMLLIGIILLERITGYDILPIGKVTNAVFTAMLRIVRLA